MATLDFIFDVASPNAYMAHEVLPGILDRTGAQLNVIPCLLGGIFKATGNQAPFAAFANVKGKLAYDGLEMRRFVAKHGLDRFKMNSHFPLNTLSLMRAAIVAQRDGRLDAYVDALLRLVWEEDQKMDDPEVFVRCMGEAGFDGAKLLEGTKDPSVKAELVDNTNAAVARGAFGIPTFYVGDEMFFGKERLGQVEEALAEAR